MHSNKEERHMGTWLCVGAYKDDAGKVHTQTLSPDDTEEEDIGPFDDFHVVPFMDAQPHEWSQECSCDPSVEALFNQDGDMKYVISHNSFDGREAVELAKRTLKERE